MGLQAGLGADQPQCRGRIFTPGHLRCYMPYFVEAYADDCKLTATHWSSKRAFAAAIDWHVLKRLSAVSIRDGTKNYSIAEFSEAMALQAETI